MLVLQVNFSDRIFYFGRGAGPEMKILAWHRNIKTVWLQVKPVPPQVMFPPVSG